MVIIFPFAYIYPRLFEIDYLNWKFYLLIIPAVILIIFIGQFFFVLFFLIFLSIAKRYYRNYSRWKTIIIYAFTIYNILCQLKILTIPLGIPILVLGTLWFTKEKSYSVYINSLSFLLSGAFFLQIISMFLLAIYGFEI